MIDQLLAEILRDGHGYVPGLEPTRPSRIDRRVAGTRRLADLARERSRDLVERAAARLGFTRRHFDPDHAASRLVRILAMSQELEQTYARLSDERSRRAMLEVLKLRVLGPYHVRLGITAEAFRADQAHVESELCLKRGTFEVSDPWFTPLSLYRVPLRGGTSVTLHAHSVDLTAVYLQEQYRYVSDTEVIQVEPGDVVLDVGGCWGDTALYFAELVGPAGKVYTFEFDPESLHVLRMNLSLNPHLAERIEIVELAIWDRPGESLPYVPAGRMTSLAADEEASDAPRVTTTTLDDFVAERSIRQIGFIKLDVEGAELNVIEGGWRTLRELAPRLALAAYHRDDDLGRLSAAIDSLDVGYRQYLDTFSPVEEESVLFAARPSDTPAPPQATRLNNSA